MKPVIAIDTETHRFGPGRMAPPVVCLSWAFDNKSGLLVGRDNIRRFLEDVLKQSAEGALVIVGHYMAYDMACLGATFPDLLPVILWAYDRDGVACTVNREKLCDIAAGCFRFAIDAEGNQTKNDYDLADLVRLHFGETLAKGEDTWRLRYGELDGVPLDQWPEDAKEYAIKDAVECLRLYNAQEETKRRLNYFIPTEFDEVRADFALKLMSTWGIRTDPPRVLSFWNETAARMAELAEGLVACGLAREKKPSKQTSLFEEEQPDRLSLPAVSQIMDATRRLVKDTYRGDPPLTPKGSISTAAEVLTRCRSKELQKLVEYKSLEKNASTFLSKYFEPVIHARFNGIGAASDRTSCAKPNLQQLPRAPGFRECFIPRSGRVFCSTDFDTQEMRTLAQSCLDICGKSRLAERYRENAQFDPHLEFAAALAEVSREEALRLKEAGDKRIKDFRQQSKCANFGLPGGLGAEGFVSYSWSSWGVKISQFRAEELKREWFQQWPEMHSYFEHVRNVIGWKRGSLGTIQIPQSGFQRGGVGYTDACNSYFQTLAAHCSKRALWEVTKRCYGVYHSALYGSRPVVFVHDEVITETPEEMGHEVAVEMPVIMMESMNRYTPQIPSMASAVLMARWSKGAEQVRDERGRMIPWRETI